jgi:hypothetical protein
MAPAAAIVVAEDPAMAPAAPPAGALVAIDIPEVTPEPARPALVLALADVSLSEPPAAADGCELGALPHAATHNANATE